ncbi:hypothetical protein [Fusobacterium polymorphum]|uniref:hypothetical protein n=1 Tax=Fusobacterium nucleatum subsp. polymorphum TaxID=76857 RepID=UPI0030D05F44
MKSIFKIPLEIRSKDWGLNKIYAGIHWNIRSKDKDYITTLVMSIVGIKKAFERPVSIKMSFNSGLDVSNHAYLFKMIEDALVKCKVINDDTDKYVKSITMEKQKEFKGVIVEVEEISE